MRLNKLTELKIRNAKPGKYGDGGGLQFVVDRSLSKRWVYRYRLNGKDREMGLGPYPDTTLSNARELAQEARRQVRGGIDPIEHRKAANSKSRHIPTFREIAALVIPEAQALSKNAKVRYQWELHLGPAYCAAILDRPINGITTVDVVDQVLRPIWDAKHSTAKKLLHAVRRVFDRGRVILKAQHEIIFENPTNPADLKAQGLTNPSRLKRGHHPALPYGRLPAFIRAISDEDTIAAKALSLLILTNVRTSNVLEALWTEFDMDKALWSIPVSKLKDGKFRKEPFRVPLSKQALNILANMQRYRSASGLIFPGQKRGKPLSNMAMTTLIRRMNSVAEPASRWLDEDGQKTIVPHGFRSTFRVWAEEQGKYQHTVIEIAMGHAVGTKVEQAYLRTDVLEQRKELMKDWGEYCGTGRSHDGPV